MQIAQAAVDVREPTVGARVYVWELPVRVTHWVVALSMVVLMATGFYISHPFVVVSGRAVDHFVMGTMKVVHFYAAIVFDVALAARIGWMFAGNTYAGWDQFLPTTRERARGVLDSVAFWLFIRRRPPYRVGLDPFAGLMFALLFLLDFIMIATGFALYSVSAPLGSPMRVFRFLIPLLGGLRTEHWVHHVGMWLLIIFVIYHIYSLVLFASVERIGTLESIFTGYKFVTGGASKDESRDE